METVQKDQNISSFMEITGCSDPALAQHYLEMGQNDMNNAIQLFMETGGNDNSNQNNTQNNNNHNQTPPRNNVQNNQNNFHQINPQLYQNNQHYEYQNEDIIDFEDDDYHQMDQFQYQQYQHQNIPQQPVNAEVKKYLDFLKQKEGEGSVSKIIKSTTGGIKSIWNTLVPVNIRGATQGGEEFIQEVRQQVNEKALIKFEKGSLEDNLNKTQRLKPLMIFIYHEKHPSQKLQLNLIQDPSIKEFCDKNFINLGILFKSQEAEIIKKDVQTNLWPCFTVYRKSIYEKEELVGFVSISIDKQDPKYYIEQLKNLRSDFVIIKADEDKIVKQAEQQKLIQQFQTVSPLMFGINPNYLAQQQQRQQQVSQQQSQQQMINQTKLEQERLVREEQDRIFKLEEEKALQQQMKKIQEEEEQQILEQIKQQEEKEFKERLKKRKQSIPAEPQDKEGVITFAFRLSNGDKTVRKFRKTDQVQILFDFVETLDQNSNNIPNIKIDLVQTLPPISLMDKQDKQIGEVFTEGDQEQLIVKEIEI